MKYSELIKTMNELQAEDNRNVFRLSVIVAIDDAGISLDGIDEVAPYMENLYEDYQNLRWGSRDFDDFCWAVAQVMENNGLSSPMDLTDEQIEQDVWSILEGMGS